MEPSTPEGERDRDRPGGERPAPAGYRCPPDEDRITRAQAIEAFGKVIQWADRNGVRITVQGVRFHEDEGPTNGPRPIP